jgi:hypothetical protein
MATRVVKYDILRKLPIYEFIFLINTEKHEHDENFEDL